ncbi:MAG: Rab family GTPase [Promethearchaeota archaeon]|jgi:small GTP-binding protein
MAEEEKRKWALKLAVLGDSAVGKTSLINKYISGTFTESYKSTLGVNILTKDIVIAELSSEIRLILWDIAGQDKYELTRQLFFEGCHGSLLVYDISREPTFKHIKSKWVEDFKNYARPDGIYCLVGNKTDLVESRAVLFEEGKSLSEELNATEFIETSAKSGDNVEEAFINITIKVLQKFGVKLKST